MGGRVRSAVIESRISRGVSLVLVLVVSGACSGGAAAGSPRPSAIVASATHDPIRVTLTLEGPPRNDATSWASMRVENTGDRAVRWAGGGCGDPGAVYIDMPGAFETGRSDWPGRLGAFKALALGSDDPRSPGTTNVGYIAESRFGIPDVACPASLRIESLPAGEDLDLRAAWDGRILDGVAPVGPATVLAIFSFVGVDGTVNPDSYESIPISAKVATNVVGRSSARPASPGFAIDAALADPQFAAFVEAAPETTWINPDLNRIDGIWKVGLFRFGDGQLTLWAELGVDDGGRIVSRRFEP